MVEKGTRTAIFRQVDRRNRDTLLPIIKDNVKEGVVVRSDCWKAYSSLEDEGYVHRTVNHKETFKADDGTCTKQIEGLWGLIKLKIKERKGVLHSKIDSVLDEFCYKYRYGLSNGDVYKKLLRDVSKYSSCLVRSDN